MKNTISKNSFYNFLQIPTLLLVVLLQTACGSKEAEKQSTVENTDNSLVELSELQIKNAGIETGIPERKAISATVKLNGKVDVPPQNRISVSFPMGGYLVSTKLLPGMQVKKGEVMAVLEDAQFVQLQQDYLTAKSRLSYAELEFKRQQSLNQNKASSDKVFQIAKTEFESLGYSERALSEKLKLIGVNPNTLNQTNLSRKVNLYAPISGFVAQVMVNVGKYVMPTDVLFELVNPDDLHLSLIAFEEDIPKLAPGQLVKAHTNINPNQLIDGEIHIINRNIDQNNAAEVHVHILHTEADLSPGMFVSAEIETLSHEALTVPNDAVVRWQNEHFVFIERSAGVYEMKKVKLGVSENDFTEIIPVDDEALDRLRIVIKNAYNILMQMKNTGEE
ncbi:MAG: efflux transporter periplasmic adaptor subunit [Bacteroidetes bacterium HGW-Bacteroidetes-13]|nr:MAG: efflux transporter periplasmic adaptor subunit [Bacteroidetes bacterium HGW-Bacteroidetes-13]